MKNSPLRRPDSVLHTNEGTIAETFRSYGSNIVERSFQFGLQAILLYRHMQVQNDSVARILSEQLLRSATAVGANIEEAQSAESRADFIHKLRIAQKEARESRYWIRLLREAQILAQEKSDDFYRESDEILRVISKIIVNTQANSSTKK